MRGKTPRTTVHVTHCSCFWLYLFLYILVLTLIISSKWRNIQNWGNIPLKTSTSFSSPWRTSHCSTNATSFPLNSSMALSKTCVSHAWGSPRGTQMPSPQANVPPPGLAMWANAPRLPGGGGGGGGHCWNWLMHYICQKNITGIYSLIIPLLKAKATYTNVKKHIKL